MQITISILCFIISSFLQAKTATVKPRLDNMHGLKNSAHDQKLRENETKKKKLEITGQVRPMIHESVNEYEECEPAITDTSDDYYQLKRLKIKVGKTGDELQYFPLKNDPTTECAVMVLSRLKPQKVLGRLVSYCNTDEYSTGMSKNNNKDNTFLKGSVLGKEAEFDPNFYYRLVGNKFMKAACIIQPHKDKEDKTKKTEKDLPQYIAIQKQNGHCEPDTYGIEKVPEQVVKATGANPW